MPNKRHTGKVCLCTWVALEKRRAFARVSKARGIFMSQLLEDYIDRELVAGNRKPKTQLPFKPDHHRKRTPANGRDTASQRLAGKVCVCTWIEEEKRREFAERAKTKGVFMAQLLEDYIDRELVTVLPKLPLDQYLKMGLEDMLPRNPKAWKRKKKLAYARVRRTLHP